MLPFLPCVKRANVSLTCLATSSSFTAVTCGERFTNFLLLAPPPVLVFGVLAYTDLLISTRSLPPMRLRFFLASSEFKSAFRTRLGMFDFLGTTVAASVAGAFTIGFFF